MAPNVIADEKSVRPHDRQRFAPLPGSQCFGCAVDGCSNTSPFSYAVTRTHAALQRKHFASNDPTK